MTKQLLSTLAINLMFLSGFAQIVNYDDVGVIVNDKSTVSLQIGEYFKQARNIPEQNMIHIETVTNEAIDTVEFRNIQYQIKNYILQQGLETKLKYLVTTKGVPFDIEVDSCTLSPNYTFTSCSSVESELALLLSTDSTHIVKSNAFPNPYFKDTTHIGSSNLDLLLVSRLDGKTREDVFNLIDRSGPETYVNKKLGKFIFDISYCEQGPTFDLFSSKMYHAIDTLNNRGWNTLFDGDTLVPRNEENVIGFVGFIRRIYEEQLNYSWEKASFAELIISGPVVTFYDSLNYSNNIQLSDMIGEGCTSGSAYVHSTWGSMLTDYTVFFGRYTEEKVNPFNLAESYYMAIKSLSWMNLLVGDPKTTITTEEGSAIATNSHTFDGLAVYPNPARRTVNISLNSTGSARATLLLSDQTGRTMRKVKYEVNQGRNQFQIDVNGLPVGLYFISIIDETGGGEIQKLMICH